MRTFVSERSFSRSASRGHVWSGWPSGLGQIRTVPSSLVEATKRPVGSTRTPQIGAWWPIRSCGSSPVTGPTRTIPSRLPVTTRVPEGSQAMSVTRLPWLASGQARRSRRSYTEADPSG